MIYQIISFAHALVLLCFQEKKMNVKIQNVGNSTNTDNAKGEWMKEVH